MNRFATMSPDELQIIHRQLLCLLAWERADDDLLMAKHRAHIAYLDEQVDEEMSRPNPDQSKIEDLLDQRDWSRSEYEDCLYGWEEDSLMSDIQDVEEVLARPFWEDMEARGVFGSPDQKGANTTVAITATPCHPRKKGVTNKSYRAAVRSSLHRAGVDNCPAPVM